MDDFTLQRKIFRHIIKYRPSFMAGMQNALGAVCDAKHGDLWAPCKPHLPKLLAKTQANWIAWFDHLTKSRPMPENTELLWFEVPSDLNPAMTSVSAYEKLGPANQAYGADEPRTWPMNEQGVTIPKGVLKLPELDEFFAQAGCEQVPDGDTADKLRPGVYALQYAAAALLVLNGLPRNAVAALASRNKEGLSAVIGWMSGDVDAIGTLRTDQWHSIRRATEILSPASSHELDPDSDWLDIRKYLAAGGDPNKRNKAGKPIAFTKYFLTATDVRALRSCGADFKLKDSEGNSILHRQWHTEEPVVRQLLAAGADARAVSPHDGPVLFAFCFREWNLIKMLIDHGADFKGTFKGRTFLDACIGRGVLTGLQLNALWRRGARFGSRATPLSTIAETGHYFFENDNRLIQCISFCLQRGFDIDKPAVRTPLWVSLLKHAEELEHSPKTLKAHRNTYEGTKREWGVNHDRVSLALLRIGANPNARYKPGLTPLIPKNATPLMVQRYDDAKLVKALLKHGADPTLKSAEGMTALDYAKAAQKKKHLLANVGVDEVVEVLEKAMARAAKPASKQRK